MPRKHDSEPDAKALANLLSSRPLQRLIEGTKHQQILEQLIQDIIPKNILDNVTSYQIDQQQLVIAVTTASWATRLRAHRNDLLYGAERHRGLGRLTDVKIILRPPNAGKSHKKAKKELPLAPPPSEQSIDLVNTVASNCDNEELKCALSRLAANMQTYTDKKKS
jgi:hypothetical protein